MDWKVTVKTRSGYVKDVMVCDYCYPSDAVSAAMAQSDAVGYISYEHIPDNNIRSNKIEYIHKSSSSYNYNIKSLDEDFNRFEYFSFITGVLCIPVGIFNSIFFYIGSVLIFSTFIHYFIRYIKKHLI